MATLYTTDRTRYPLSPLLEHLRARGLTLKDVARYGVGISGTTLKRGTIAWQTADRVAGVLCEHPSAIWPEWFGDVS